MTEGDRRDAAMAAAFTSGLYPYFYADYMTSFLVAMGSGVVVYVYFRLLARRKREPGGVE
jgi:hypothetical protein